jgi:hypothetical protein
MSKETKVAIAGIILLVLAVVGTISATRIKSDLANNPTLSYFVYEQPISNKADVIIRKVPGSNDYWRYKIDTSKTCKYDASKLLWCMQTTYEYKSKVWTLLPKITNGSYVSVTRTADNATVAVSLNLKKSTIRATLNEYYAVTPTGIKYWHNFKPQGNQAYRMVLKFDSILPMKTHQLISFGKKTNIAFTKGDEVFRFNWDGEADIFSYADYNRTTKKMNMYFQPFIGTDSIGGEDVIIPEVQDVIRERYPLT